MIEKKFPPKPAAPSVRQTIGAAIARSRVLTGEAPMSQKQVVQDVLAKLDLLAALKTQLRERHDLDK